MFKQQYATTKRTVDLAHLNILKEACPYRSLIAFNGWVERWRTRLPGIAAVSIIAIYKTEHNLAFDTLAGRYDALVQYTQNAFDHSQHAMPLRTHARDCIKAIHEFNSIVLKAPDLPALKEDEDKTGESSGAKKSGILPDNQTTAMVQLRRALHQNSSTDLQQKWNKLNGANTGFNLKASNLIAFLLKERNITSLNDITDPHAVKETLKKGMQDYFYNKNITPTMINQYETYLDKFCYDVLGIQRPGQISRKQPAKPAPE